MANFPSSPLRIGLVCYPLIGGSGILATALGHELARRGHEVHFFAYERPVRLDLSLPRVHFHRVVVNEYGLFKYPDYTLPLAVQMATVARERALDTFHVHYAVPHATAAWLAVDMLRQDGRGRMRDERVPKIVTTLHGTDATLLGRDPSYRPAIEHALGHSDAITAVSESLRLETLRTFQLVGPASVETVHNFFVPAPPTRTRAEVRADLGVGDGEFLVVHGSNLRPGKRVDLLLRTLAATRGNTRLLILAGEPFAAHAPSVAELGLDGRVIVRENVVDVGEFIEAADAGLSTSENESFGLSILETLFHGRPVVAFNVGGIPEVMRDGAHGFLHPFGDVAGMAASLDRLSGSPDLARTLGEQGQRHARAQFSAARIVPRYENIYRRLLARTDRAAAATPG